MEVTLSPIDTANMEAAQSRSDSADGTRTPASLEGQHRTLPSMHWSSDNLLPQFSSVVQPLLKGLDISKKDHRQHSKQLRHELIHFLNENKLIQDGNCAMRRWKYFALGESLASTYPNMLWEDARKDKKGRTKSPKSVFMTKLSEARRHRAHRWAAREAAKTPVVQNAVVPPELDAESASNELTALSKALGPAGPFNKERLFLLLHATLRERKTSPVACLPCYFLNEDIMTLETELRFGDNVANLLQRLSKVKQLVSTICNRQMDFAEIDDYLRGRHAKCALITLSDVSAEDTASPGPRIFWGISTKIVSCGGPGEIIKLNDATLEKALLLCLTVYYVKDITYPSAFAQTLGLVQSAISNGEKFPRCWANSRLVKILESMKVT
ncbi:uncharacterized protein LOC121048438 [Ixodes scapularis]|uniref:uncharacterized protein LOC121048438 n=1 Tax=Ixodes scapularis TaxID=6945 RepID=UPI001AD6A537|nr:uncharacterized protein LOC121048438 [Ixodes scapularis]